FRLRRPRPSKVGQLMAEPGALALGVAAGGAPAPLRRPRGRGLPPLVAEPPPPPRGVFFGGGREGGGGGGGPPAPRPAPPPRPPIELPTLDREEDPDRALRIERGLHAVAMPIGE